MPSGSSSKIIRKAIGAVKDKTSIRIAKVTTNNIEVTILKATTHDDVPIEQKYVTHILHMISSDKSLAAVCARTIGKRIGKTKNWIVALKSLMLLHRIFQDGDPYFQKEVAKRRAKILKLSNFRDDLNSIPWDYTVFVRTFALYLDDLLDCFLTGKLLLRRRSNNNNNNNNKAVFPNNYSMTPPEMLLDKICYWQRLLDRVIGTMPTGGVARTNRLIQTCLYAVVRESFDLYRDISEALALVLDSFFHNFGYQSCLSAFQSCIKASKQFEDLSCFYQECQSMGVGKTSEYPYVQKISGDLVETLEEFLKDQTNFDEEEEEEDEEDSVSLEDLMNTTTTRTTCTTSTIISSSSPCPSNFSSCAEQFSSTMTSPTPSFVEQFTDCTTSPSHWDHHFFDSSHQMSNDNNNANANANGGWELVLFGVENLRVTNDFLTPVSKNDIITPDQNYNPFLDTCDANPTTTPTFQCMPPTFSSSISSFDDDDEENDPFAPWPNMINYPSHQLNGVLFEQQLWLHNQNNVITKQSKG